MPKPEKMTVGDVAAMVNAQRAHALAAMTALNLMDDRSRAMDYYLGHLDRDMPAPEGRSKAISSDVSNVVDGLMPHLMDIFAGSDEVVRFEPVGPEDEEAAAQETDYVNHVFMQRNPGFMILYAFIKDALLLKNGVVKVFWEEREEESRETYYDMSDDQFVLLAQAVAESDGMMEIIEHSMHDEQMEPVGVPENEVTS